MRNGLGGGSLPTTSQPCTRKCTARTNNWPRARRASRKQLTLNDAGRPGEEIFDPVRISPGQPSCIQWHLTSSLQQFLGRTDLKYPRYHNFGTDNLKQVVINSTCRMPKKACFCYKICNKTML